MDIFPIVQELLIQGLLLSVLLMFGFWLLSLRIKNVGVIDIGWAFSLVCLVVFYVVKGDGFIIRSSLVALMVTFWGLRLNLLLMSRMLREKGEDRRYQKLREVWKPNIEGKFLVLFLAEALLALILSIPFLLVAINGRPQLQWIEMVGVFIWFLGFSGETISDEQLKIFKNDPQNKGKTCNIGFWYFSRHPNYFCEWLMWVGYSVFAWSSPLGWTTVLCPLIMYYVLIYVTGVPFAEEQSLLSRGEEYRRYQQTTSMFFPMPKRKVRYV